MHSPVPVSWQGNSDSVGTAQTICDASPISWATASINPDTGISVINSFDFNPLFQQSRFSSFSQMLSACSSFVRPSVGYMEGCCETGVYNKLYGMDPSSIGLSNYPPLSLCPNDKTLNSICQAPGPANPKLNGGEDVVSGCNV